jgi:hypothetical protein
MPERTRLGADSADTATRRSPKPEDQCSKVSRSAAKLHLRSRGDQRKKYIKRMKFRSDLESWGKCSGKHLEASPSTARKLSRKAKCIIRGLMSLAKTLGPRTQGTRTRTRKTSIDRMADRDASQVEKAGASGYKCSKTRRKTRSDGRKPSWEAEKRNAEAKKLSLSLFAKKRQQRLRDPQMSVEVIRGRLSWVRRRKAEDEAIDQSTNGHI